MRIIGRTVNSGSVITINILVVDVIEGAVLVRPVGIPFVVDYRIRAKNTAMIGIIIIAVRTIIHASISSR